MPFIIHALFSKFRIYVIVFEDSAALMDNEGNNEQPPGATNNITINKRRVTLLRGKW